MTLYDSSVVIDYLDGVPEAVEYVEEHAGGRAVAPPLVLFEVYQGDVFRARQADFDAVDAAIEWLHVIDVSVDHARAAATLQDELQQRGVPLSARDAFVAGTAKAAGDRLVVADADFDVPGLDDLLQVEIL